jgi:tRNA-Thr(GGU) m(6)t(6)A37 methyltransferase TsaA
LAGSGEEVYQLRPIGVIRTPFRKKEGAPIQGHLAPETTGTVEVFPEFAEGLKDVEGFSHIVLVYWFHESQGYKLLAKPFLDDVERGIFAIRAPRRPNPVGLTTVRLARREGSVLHICGVDMLDGTPLLDIKPYVPEFDRFEDVRRGWLEGRLEDPHRTRADDRFTERQK